MKWSGNFIPKSTIIAEARKALENALLEARQTLENDIEELGKVHGRLVKFRFHNKQPVEPFVSNVSPELIKRIIETAEQVDYLETRLQKMRHFAANDNMP